MTENKNFMLEIKNLTKKYKGAAVPSVSNLSACIEGGQVFGLLGPNGAGKSTTIKSVVGILNFEQGDILIDGVSIKKDSKKYKKQIAYVSDNHAVFEGLTGNQYIDHIANLYNVPVEDRKEVVEKYAKLFSMEKFLNNKISSYSHGMKQKVNVMAALVHNPKVWILDEPLLGLDPQSAYELKNAMKEHAQKGNIVVFSSHMIDMVSALCQKAIVIVSGKVVNEYNVAEMKEKGEDIEQQFLNDVKYARKQG